ncbi:hypothetical protein SUGI_0584260 [Cryptomeria japonica]|nr:hypothetical protein SUGI_0584260 [Cryptomeria japonica]
MDTFPRKYLGIPLFVGRNKSSFVADISSTIQNRISSWKNSWLLLVGRILMIKCVRGKISNYIMPVLPMPKCVLNSIESSIEQFLYKGPREKKHKMHLLAWDKCCDPKKAGGTGIHNLLLRNLVLGAMLV